MNPQNLLKTAYMNTSSLSQRTLFIFLFALISNFLCAQQRIAVLQEPFVVLLDPIDGSIIDPTFIDLSSLNPGTPKDLLQVENELWISDQLEDRIDRFDLTGVYLGALTTGLDNIKGMDIVNQTEVWVTNSGSGNGAPGNSIVRLDFAGNNLGFFSTNGDTAFDLIDTGSEVYLSYINANTRIERRDYTGALLGDLVPTGVVTFIQQLSLNPLDDTIYAAVFSNSGGNTAGLYEFSRTDGSLVNSWPEGSLRGVMPLDNGQVLLSAGGGYGVKIFDPISGSGTTLWTAASQYMSRINLSPCTTPPTPTGEANQTFDQGAILLDIVVDPNTVIWYATENDALTNQNALLGTTILIDGATYYAVSVVDDCPSLPLAVTITLVVLEVTENPIVTCQLYPNPVKDQLRIKSNEVIQEITIFSALGRYLLAETIQEKETALNLEHYPTGVYFIVVNTEKERKVLRFIKQ